MTEEKEETPYDSRPVREYAEFFTRQRYDGKQVDIKTLLCDIEALRWAIIKSFASAGCGGDIRVAIGIMRNCVSRISLLNSGVLELYKKDLDEMEGSLNETPI